MMDKNDAGRIVIADHAGDDQLLHPFGMEEHPQGGFHGLLEVIPTKADYVLDLIRANSLWPLLSGLSCCAIEMMSTATSVNDMDRFGMFPFRASPRQADVLIVAGTLTTKMAGPLVRIWEQMPEPKWCVAMGTCTTSGGRFKRSYSVVQGVDRVMPVDVYVPGCPPRPEGLIHGMMRLQELVKAAPRPVAHLCRPWAAAPELGRRRALTAPARAEAVRDPTWSRATLGETARRARPAGALAFGYSSSVSQPNTCSNFRSRALRSWAQHDSNRTYVTEWPHREPNRDDPDSEENRAVPAGSGPASQDASLTVPISTPASHGAS